MTDQQAADATVDVLGESFMRLVRERLRIQISVGSAADSSTSVSVFLVDSLGMPMADGERGPAIIHSDTFTLQLMAVTPMPPPLPPPPALIVRKGF